MNENVFNVVKATYDNEFFQIYTRDGNKITLDWELLHDLSRVISNLKECKPDPKRRISDR